MAAEEGQRAVAAPTHNSDSPTQVKKVKAHEPRHDKEDFVDWGSDSDEVDEKGHTQDEMPEDALFDVKARDQGTDPYWADTVFVAAEFDVEQQANAAKK